jgi:type VI secretion system protein ImpF
MQDRLQPSLLDRLTDDDPNNKKESRDQRVFSLARLRAAVLRDLTWLLNTAQYDATDDLSPYPNVQTSVLNFGVPAFSGKAIAGLKPNEIQNRLAAALRVFEPRLLPETVNVSIAGSNRSASSLEFRIEGDLWAQPVPVRMFMKTEMDRELDTIRVVENQGSRNG